MKLQNFLMVNLALGLVVMLGCSMNEFGGSSTRSADDPNQLSGKIVLTGSSTVAPVIQEIAVKFEEQHPDVRIDVQSGGSSRGIRDARSGISDIGMASRDLKPEELDTVHTKTIAWDGVAFLVHAKNPVQQLSENQLRDIYQGKIKNWSQVGGRDGKIIVANRANGRSELSLVCDFLNIKAGDIKANIVDGETQQSIKSVVSNPGVITYTSVGAAQDAAAHGQPVKLLPLAGVAASADTIQAGDFPLARPLLLIVKNDNDNDSQQGRLVEAFVKFAMSEEVSQAATGLGFVPAQ